MFKMNFRIAKLTTWMLTAAVLMLLWVVHPMVVHAQGAAPAVAPTDPGTPLDQLLVMVLKIVFSILGVVATYLTTKAIKYFEQKTHIDIPAATEDLLFKWADQAIALAYEKAHQVLQQTGNVLDGHAKLTIAIQYVVDMIQKYGLDTMVEDKVKQYIESKLGAMRMDNGGVPVPLPVPTTTPPQATPAPAASPETVVVAK